MPRPRKQKKEITTLAIRDELLIRLMREGEKQGFSTWNEYARGLLIHGVTADERIRREETIPQTAPAQSPQPSYDWPRILREIAAGKSARTPYDNVTVQAAIRRLEETGKIRHGEYSASVKKEGDRQVTVIRHHGRHEPAAQG